jgi:hypothetical protein
VYELPGRRVLERFRRGQCERLQRLPVERNVRGWERVVRVQAGVHRRRRGCLHRVRCGDVQGNEREWGLHCMSRKLKLERRKRDLRV